MDAYKSKVTSKGQIVIPKHIRVKYGITHSTLIRWIPRDDGLLMVPDSEDPIYKAKGLFKKSGLLKKLAADKKRDKKMENQQFGKSK